jgi:hypothetical protein
MQDTIPVNPSQGPQAGHASQNVRQTPKKHAISGKRPTSPVIRASC